jgi:hypothetical protein
MTMRAVWQVSGGANGRYAEVFLKHGVALIDPGDTGSWRPDRADADFGGSLVRRFASEPQIGDAVLLRTGLSTIRAVGLIASDYLYLPQFDDVNGRDLQHARRVRWFALPEEHDFGSKAFGASTPVFSRVSQADLVDYAMRFINSPPTHWQSAALPTLPVEAPPLDEVPEYLQGLVAQVSDLLSLYNSAANFGEYPMEDELVAHFIVPFLRALGWQVEHIAIKWRYIDVSVFRTLPRTPENCQFIIEAKRSSDSVEGALDQAKDYVEALGVPRDIVVTDGLRYRLYGAECHYQPVAYANLARLKQPALELFARLRRP